MATTEEETPMNTVGENGVESEGETKEVKGQTDEDESKKAEDGEDEEDKGIGENKRTVASKSEGEEDDTDLFPEGAVSQSPEKSQTLPATSSPITSPASPTSPTSADKKKKRFHPFKSIRKLFSSRKRPNKEDEDVLPTQPLSRSTGHLDRSDTDEDAMDRSTLQGGRMSMSEDSVFSPEPAEDISLSRPVTPANKDFANELASKLQTRQPSSPPKKEEKPQPSVKIEDILDESSDGARDSGVILDDEKSFSPSSASAAPAMVAKQKVMQKKQAATTDSLGFGDFDHIAPTNLLVSDAAKHRISVRPKGKTRRPPSRIRPVSTPVKSEDTEDISTRAKSPLASSSSAKTLSPGVSPPALKVPKENKPAQRSNSDRIPSSSSDRTGSPVRRTPSDATKDKEERTSGSKLSRKPSKEKAVVPPAVVKRKEKEEEDAPSTKPKQPLSRKASKETELPNVQENSDIKKESSVSSVKGKQPLSRKSSKERAVSPPIVIKRKEEEDVEEKKTFNRKASKETSLPDVVEGNVKSDKVKDSEEKEKKPKVKSPVKLPVEHKSDKVTVKHSSSKTESDTKDKPLKKDTVIAKEEEKENKAPSPAPTETTSDKKSTPENKEPNETESAEKKLASVLTGKAVFESEPAPVKASVKPQEKKKDTEKTLAKEDKLSEKISAEEKKKPVTPPKPRKQFKRPESPSANKIDDKSDDEAPSKPLSLKERMALLNNAAGKKSTSDKSPTPSWKKSQPKPVAEKPKPVPAKPTKSDAKPSSPKNVFIQVTDSPKSPPVENGKKEVDSNDNRAGVKDLIKQWQHNRPEQTANAL